MTEPTDDDVLKAADAVHQHLAVSDAFAQVIARAALSAVLPGIVERERERCAKVARDHAVDQHIIREHECCGNVGETIAAAIRGDSHG